MTHSFYITPNEYKKAESLGIDAFNLERRVRLLGWTKEKAISTPLRKVTNRKHWAQIAESNGINYNTFMSRINIYGMSEEEAATKPLQNRKKQAAINTEIIRKFPKEYVQLAEQNGITYHTFRARVLKGWSLNDAATRPKLSNSECGKLGAKAYEEKHGRFHKLIFKKIK